MASTSVPAALASTTQRILHWARRTPRAVAVIEHDASYSYSDLAVGIAQWVRALTASSVRPGMLVGIQHERRYLHLLLIQACQVLGATSISFSRGDLSGDDPIRDRCDLLCVRHSGEATDAGLLGLSQPVIDQVATLPVAMADLEVLDRRPAPTDIVRLVKTSGSTGRAKVLAMSQAAMERLLEKTVRFPGDPGYAWNFLNLYDYTLRSALMETEIALRFGQVAVSTTTDGIWADMRRFAEFRATLVCGDAVRLAGAIPPDWQGPRYGLLSIKGGALPDGVRARLRARVATHVYHNYAANETHRIAMIDDDGVGTVEPGVEVRVVGEDGEAVPFGGVGQIVVRPPLVDAYQWDPDATAQAFRDGWYYTSDIGIMPSAGRVVVLGRTDDMVVLGGVKFAPQALESRIRALPGLRDAVLLAVTDASGAEDLAVVLETDMTALTPPMERALTEILAGMVWRFTPYLQPDLPRTQTGKVQRGVLRRLLAPAPVQPGAAAG